MAEKELLWNDGRTISVTYNGDGDGSATFSSDTNEGIDQEREVTFKVNDSVKEVRTIKQEGLREVFSCADGDFILADGGTFNVLKGGGEMETYTPLTYIESFGSQYINLEYVVKETDVIEMDYSIVSTASADRFLFGTADGANGLWISNYGNSGYIRFGYNASYQWSSFKSSKKITLKKGSIKVDSTTRTLSYRAMPESPLFLFSSRNNSTGQPYGYGYIQLKSFKISDDNGVVMELLPNMRDSDGKVGLLDTISGKFYINNGSDADFKYA